MADRTDADLIAEARGLAEAATPGPWLHGHGHPRACSAVEDEDGNHFATGPAHDAEDEGADVAAERAENDVAFIRAARTLVPDLCDRLERALADNARLAEDVKRLRAEKDGAYSQRNKLAVLLASMLGGGLVDAQPQEPAWSKVLTFHLPHGAGQASFHLHDSELPYVLSSRLIRYDGTPWDGHDDAEKWRRVAAASGISASVLDRATTPAPLASEMDADGAGSRREVKP